MSVRCKKHNYFLFTKRLLVDFLFLWCILLYFEIINILNWNWITNLFGFPMVESRSSSGSKWFTFFQKYSSFWHLASLFFIRMVANEMVLCYSNGDLNTLTAHSHLPLVLDWPEAWHLSDNIDCAYLRVFSIPVYTYVLFKTERWPATRIRFRTPKQMEA